MKRYGNLYSKICDRDNIRLAIKNASRDHAKDPAVIRMRENPEPYVEAIHEMLVTKSFHQSRYHTKTIYERGKYRTLNYTRTFPDRVVQHCLLQVAGHALMETYITDSYASIPHKGLHRGCKRVKEWLNDENGTQYCLKMDVRHYYDSVDRDLLFQMVERKIKCKDTLALFAQFIYYAPGTGIPIGNYLSQFLSNYYLSEFDHYCKEKLSIKYYIRYMDDIVIFGYNKSILNNIRIIIQNKLKQYRLTLKQNYQIFPTDSRGVDFLGFVFRHSYTKMRKRVKLSYIKSVNKMIYNIKHHIQLTTHMILSHISYVGIIGWSDSKNLYKKYDHKLEGYIIGAY